MGNSQLQSDGDLGPQRSGVFDFTLLFQHIFFTIIPAALILFVTPIYIYCIMNQVIIIRRGILFGAKIGLGVALVLLNVAAAVLWARLDFFRTKVSLAATALSCAGSLCVPVIIYAEHRYSFRQSTFLSIFLSVTTLLDLAKTRSCFQHAGLESVGALYIANLVVQFLLILSQEVSKRRLIKAERLELPLGIEAVSGFWNRSLFLWINSTFLLGFHKILGVKDLPPIGPEFNTARLFRAFEPRWKRGKPAHQTCPSHTLLYSI